MVLTNYQPGHLAARVMCALVPAAAILRWLGSPVAGGEEQALLRIAHPVYRFADAVPGAEVRHLFAIANPTQTPQTARVLPASGQAQLHRVRMMATDSVRNRG